MVGTRFRSEDGVLAANLPKNMGQLKKDRENTEEDLKHIRIRLFLGGAVASGDTYCQVNQQPVPFDTSRADPSGEVLKTRLAQLRQLLGDQKVTIDGEFQVPTRDVVCALNAAIAAGYKEINFTVPDHFRRGRHLP
ncbi:MAG: hypothetical protein AAB215_09520, partial [Planctomycetota bacterium]